MINYQMILQTSEFKVKIAVRFDDRKRWAFMDTKIEHDGKFILFSTNDIGVTTAEHMVNSILALEEVKEESDERCNMSYLLSLANELMTSPMETLESMYNEAMNRSESGDLDDSIKYGWIVTGKQDRTCCTFRQILP